MTEPHSTTAAEADAVPSTGDQSVDEALARLADASGDDPGARLDAAEALHRTLQTRLGDLDE